MTNYPEQSVRKSGMRFLICTGIRNLMLKYINALLLENFEF
jgi:hypothetical protein